MVYKPTANNQSGSLGHILANVGAPLGLTIAIVVSLFL